MAEIAKEMTKQEQERMLKLLNLVSPEKRKELEMWLMGYLTKAVSE